MRTKYDLTRKTLFNGGTFLHPGNRSCKFFKGSFRQLFGFAFTKHYLPKVHAKYGRQTRPNKHMLNKYVLPRKKFGHKNGTCVQMFGKNGMFVSHTILLQNHLRFVHT